MDSGNMGDPDLTGHTDHGTTDHTGQTDQATTQVASEESSKPKNVRNLTSWHDVHSDINAAKHAAQTQDQSLFLRIESDALVAHCGGCCSTGCAAH